MKKSKAFEGQGEKRLSNNTRGYNYNKKAMSGWQLHNNVDE